MKKRRSFLAAVASGKVGLSLVARNPVAAQTTPAAAPASDAEVAAISAGISPGNLAGLPALAMPNGFGDHGLPTGVALMGTAFAETRLTAIGKRYQQLTDFARRRPAVPRPAGA
jgi:aspartyl-tRNA(Asn)/glutamyl-tRNA(Gln) amidotransferase subunit A